MNKSAGVAPEVNLSSVHRRGRMHVRGSTMALTLRAGITRSPNLVSVAPRKGLVSSKNYKQKKSTEQRGTHH